MNKFKNRFMYNINFRVNKLIRDFILLDIFLAVGVKSVKSLEKGYRDHMMRERFNGETLRLPNGSSKTLWSSMLRTIWQSFNLTFKILLIIRNSLVVS